MYNTKKKLMVLSEETVEGELVYFYDVQARNVIYIYPVAPKYDTILIFFIGATTMMICLQMNRETREIHG
mgnify:FL=1